MPSGQTPAVSHAALVEELRSIAERVRARLTRTVEDMFVIGSELLHAKTLLGHGEFLPWVEEQVGLDRRLAQHWMNVARRFGSRGETVSHLPIAVMYELAAPSTPDHVVEDVLQGRVEPTLTQIRQAKARAGGGVSSSELGRRLAARFAKAIPDLSPRPRALSTAIWELGEGDDVRVSRQLSDLAELVAYDIEVWNEQKEQS